MRATKRLGLLLPSSGTIQETDFYRCAPSPGGHGRRPLHRVLHVPRLRRAGRDPGSLGIPVATSNEAALEAALGTLGLGAPAR